MKKFWIVFCLVAVIIGGTLLFLWHLVNRLERGPEVLGGVLVWCVDQPYEEERDDSLVAQLLRGRAPVVRELVFSLTRAAEDDQIEALLLDIQALPVDWAKVEELRSAVQAFAASGKPVVAYLEGAGTKEYALAVAADEVVLAPEAALLVLGVSAELSFLKDTLAKLGMEADFVHVGKYKSAPEQLTRSSASQANREMIEAIVEDRYRCLVDMIAAGRGQSPATVEAWIDGGIYDAPTALAQGLVDTVLCREEILETHFDGDTVTELDAYLLARPRGDVAARVALVYATGTILPGESRWDKWQGKSAGSVTVVEQLQAAREDEDIAAVLFRVDSPGGSALASDLIWHEVERVGKEKPVVVSMSGYAASGGYYVSCGADSIFADPGTLTGSIGVYAGKIDLKGFYDKIGLKREFVTRGENALLFSDNATFTTKQRDRFQGLLSNFYERFLAKVAAGRGLSRDEVAAVAEGRVWTGAQAVEHRLVDGLGGLPRAVTAIKHLIGVDPADKVALISYERQLSLLERMVLRSLNDLGAANAVPLPASIVEALAADGTLAVLPLLDGRPLALIPFRIHFR